MQIFKTILKIYYKIETLSHAELLGKDFTTLINTAIKPPPGIIRIIKSKSF